MSPDKAMIGYLQARIAELEAEVERLTVHLHLHCHEEDPAVCYYDEGVNPSGDTLGKEREDG